MSTFVMTILLLVLLRLSFWTFAESAKEDINALNKADEEFTKIAKELDLLEMVDLSLHLPICLALFHVLIY